MNTEYDDSRPLHDHDRFWRATCYLLDELTEIDRSEFERDLEADQELREALAESVRVLGCLSRFRPAVEPASIRRRSKIHSNHLIAALALSVCVLIAVVVRNQRGPFDPKSEPSLDRGAELALHWSEIRETAIDIPSDDEESEHSTDGIAGAPSWMSAALDGLWNSPELDHEEL